MVQTVNSTVTVVTLTGTNLGPFNTNWPFESSAEVGVYLETNGLEAELTLSEDFTVAGTGTLTSGGTVTLNAEQLPVSGWGNGSTGTIHRLILRRETLLNQARALSNSERVPLAPMEAALDKVARTLQDHRSVFVRTLTAPEGEIGPNIPTLAVRTGEGTRDAVTISGFDANGNLVADRTFGSFDDDVNATRENREVSDNNRELSEQAYANTNNLFAQFGIAATLVEEATQAARDETLALKEAAEAVFADTQQFYNDNIGNLGDRVAALEANLTITGFSVSPSTAEVGQSVTPTLNWTLNANPYSQAINQGVGSVTPVTARTANAAAAVTANTTWTLTVSDFFQQKTASASIAFRNRFFAGVYATNDLHTKTAAQIRTALLADSALATNATRTFSVDAGSGSPQYVYFAVPAGWALTAFTAFGLDELAGLSKSTVNINNAGGSPVSYDLYRLPEALTGIVPMVSNG